jgi:hypothetical protein
VNGSYPLDTPNDLPWHGTDAESDALAAITDRWCVSPETAQDGACSVPADEPCPAHDLWHDQRALDGLLWMRRQAKQLKVEEQHGVTDGQDWLAADHETWASAVCATGLTIGPRRMRRATA